MIMRLPSDTMIRKFLDKFLQDPSYQNLQTAWENRQISDAFRVAHTLTGTAANLGLEELMQAAGELTEQLRSLSGFPEDTALKKSE